MENSRKQRDGAGYGIRRRLHQYIGLGRTAILCLLVISLLNQLLLLLKVNYHFLFSAALPYYLNWLAGKLGGAAGVTPLKVFAVIVSLANFVVYVLCWILSARRRKWLKTALWLYCADTVALVIFAVALLNNPFSCLLEVLVHLICIWILYNANCCAERLRRMAKKRRHQPVHQDQPVNLT